MGIDKKTNSETPDGWQNGHFHRHRASSTLKPFVPVQSADRIEDVDLPRLWDSGKRLILLDVDNTLVEWKSHGVQEGVLRWLSEARALGFQLCMVSNTKRPQRLAKLSEQLDVPTVRGRFKPSRHMYHKALAKFSVRPEQTVMIGDQIMTDILGANRSGVDAIWVRQMSGHEFKGTKINRQIERILSGPIYRLLVTSEDDIRAVPGTRTKQQLLRFAIVGGSSFLVDLLVVKTLIDWTPFGVSVGNSILPLVTYTTKNLEAAYPIAKVIAGIVATYNSFIWNRLWTFEAEGLDDKRAQLLRFYIVAAGGVLIGTLVAALVYAVLPVHDVLIPNIAGSLVGAVWNFTVQRAWTFKKKNDG
jgi:HAD superfamily phosphatase (TIGR01668 family)